jgi:uncharacterized protein YqgC (DUF456 family)
MVVGLAGTVLPVLPGTFFVLAGVVLAVIAFMMMGVFVAALLI